MLHETSEPVQQPLHEGLDADLQAGLFLALHAGTSTQPGAVRHASCPVHPLNNAAMHSALVRLQPAARVWQLLTKA
jgi:hypothetical protein